MNLLPNTLARRLNTLSTNTLMLAFAVALAGCGIDAESEFAPPVVEVDVATVLAEPVTLYETFTGHLEARESVELRARVTGYIQAVVFQEGELVNEGDLLFQIDPRPYEARVRAAQADVSQASTRATLAEKEALRAERLLKNRAISQEEYDQRLSSLDNANAVVEAARAALDSAELDLDFTRVTAPINGRADRALITKGNLARADETLLTTLESVDPLYVYFNSNISNQILRDQQDDLVQLRIGLSGESGFPHQGRLDFVGNRLNADTGTLQFRGLIDNSNGHFRPGQFARVQMPVAYLEQALLVRRDAVMTNQDRRYVYTVDETDTVSMREVDIGRDMDGLLVIHDGLEAGERVVVSGTQKIFGSGMQIQANHVAMRKTSGSEDIVASGHL